MSTTDANQDVNVDKVWNKPVIEDFGVGAVTGHFFAAGIDNYEVDNPVNYGVIS